MSRYRVMMRRARPDGHRHIGIVEVDPEVIPEGKEPLRISERARGCERVVKSATLYWGCGYSSPGRRYLDACRAEVAQLNSE